MLAADDRVDYSLVDQGAQFFQIRDGQLVVGRRLEAGEYELTICATRSAARGVDDASGSTFIEHHLRVVVMKNRDKYPVFERLNYDVQVYFVFVLNHEKAAACTISLEYNKYEVFIVISAVLIYYSRNFSF